MRAMSRLIVVKIIWEANFSLNTWCLGVVAFIWLDLLVGVRYTNGRISLFALDVKIHL